MPVLKNFDQVVAIMGPPFTRRYLRDNLAGGIFVGLGCKHGQRWYLDDGDIAQLTERMRPDQPADPMRGAPSGIKRRS